MTTILVLVLTISLLVMLALDFARNRTFKHRGRRNTEAMLRYIAGLDAGLEANLRARWHG